MTGGASDLLIFLVAGLTASGHCIGMCGPFALLVGGGRGPSGRRWMKQLVFAGGRLCTYGFLGVLAGLGGQRLFANFAWLPQLQAAVAFVAATLMLATALALLGLAFRTVPRWLSGPCGLSAALRTLLDSPSVPEVFAAGVFNGFIPCGIVYAMLALAWHSRGPWQGGLGMLVFGLGTLPAMTLAGTLGPALSLRWRVSLVRAAAVLLIAAAGVTALRGVSAWNVAPASAPSCPMCGDTAGACAIPNDHQTANAQRTDDARAADRDAGQARLASSAASSAPPGPAPTAHPRTSPASGDAERERTTGTASEDGPRASLPDGSGSVR